MVVQGLMSALPDKYGMDYLVYSLGSSITEQEKIWHTDYVEVVRLMMFKRFDGWVQDKYLHRDKNE